MIATLLSTFAVSGKLKYPMTAPLCLSTTLPWSVFVMVKRSRPWTFLDVRILFARQLGRPPIELRPHRCWLGHSYALPVTARVGSSVAGVVRGSLTAGSTAPALSADSSVLHHRSAAASSATAPRRGSTATHTQHAGSSPGTCCRSSAPSRVDTRLSTSPALPPTSGSHGLAYRTVLFSCFVMEFYSSAALIKQYARLASVSWITRHQHPS